mgnify:CR=1 FL=1
MTKTGKLFDKETEEEFLLSSRTFQLNSPYVGKYELKCFKSTSRDLATFVVYFHEAEIREETVVFSIIRPGGIDEAAKVPADLLPDFVVQTVTNLEYKP